MSRICPKCVQNLDTYWALLVLFLKGGSVQRVGNVLDISRAAQRQTQTPQERLSVHHQLIATSATMQLLQFIFTIMLIFTLWQTVSRGQYLLN